MIKKHLDLFCVVVEIMLHNICFNVPGRDRFLHLISAYNFELFPLTFLIRLDCKDNKVLAFEC